MGAPKASMTMHQNISTARSSVATAPKASMTMHHPRTSQAKPSAALASTASATKHPHRHHGDASRDDPHRSADAMAALRKAANDAAALKAQNLAAKPKSKMKMKVHTREAASRVATDAAALAAHKQADTHTSEASKIAKDLQALRASRPSHAAKDEHELP